jgi:hypothetical protein
LLFLTLHVSIVLAFTFFPETFSIGQSKFAKVYEHLVHLGPFYRESTIQSSPHLTVEVGGEGKDIIAHYASAYRSNPWEVNKLYLRDFTRRAADGFLKSRNPRSEAYKNLLGITKRFYPQIRTGDEVTWKYYHQHYLPKTGGFRADTVFIHKFRWR